MMRKIEINFTGRPGDQNDEHAHAIIEKHGGHVLGAGTFIPNMARDIEAHIPNDRLMACLQDFALDKTFTVRQRDN